MRRTKTSAGRSAGETGDPDSSGTTVPRELARAEVLTTSGARVPLADTWKERAAVLAFVRHYG